MGIVHSKGNKYNVYCSKKGNYSILSSFMIDNVNCLVIEFNRNEREKSWLIGSLHVCLSLLGKISPIRLPFFGCLFSFHPPPSL